MSEPTWVSLELCLKTHEMVMEQYGGLSGVRDSGLLDSALSKPQNLLAYGKPSLFELAASYASGIVKNHPFLDGNKRTGFMVAAGFLELNNCTFSATEESAVEHTIALAAGTLRESEYGDWLKKNSTESP